MYSVHNRFIDITFCVLFSGIFMDITQLYIRAFSWEPLLIVESFTLYNHASCIHNRSIDVTFCVLFSGIFMDITQLYIRAFSWEPLLIVHNIWNLYWFNYILTLW